MESLRALKLLGEQIGDPRCGLPEDVFLFISGITPLVNVDLLIRHPEHGVLLTWRDDDFYGSGWHIPGGIIRYKERAADRIRAVARDELGAEVHFDASPMLITEAIESEARARGHLISLLFRCELVDGPSDGQRWNPAGPHPGAWAWHRGCPENLIAAHRIYAPYLSGG